MFLAFSTFPWRSSSLFYCFIDKKENAFKTKLFDYTLITYNIFIQVVSPITGQEIGIREIKVAKNKETIREMKVRVLTGLNLKVQTDQIGQRGRYSVQTAYSQVLTSKYQVSYIIPWSS